MLRAGAPLVVLLSGGRDSTCLLHLALAAGAEVTALHVNYGLRDEADGDEAHCRALCERLGAPLEVVRAGIPSGNVQQWARELRYRSAAALPGDIATGHTASDQVETVLYRLAASPGRRALLGMPVRDGRLVRPLLERGMTRADTAAHCREHGLAWREDASNASGARGSVRSGLLPALAAVHPAAERNVLRTLELLRDEAEVLQATVDLALTPSLDGLRALPPALRRLCLQRLADDAHGGRAPSVAHRADEVLALGPGQMLDLGEGVRVRIDREGRVGFGGGSPRRPHPANAE